MSEKRRSIIKLAAGVGTAVAAIFGGIFFIVKKIIPKKAATEEVTEADVEVEDDEEEDNTDTDN